MVVRYAASVSKLAKEPSASTCALPVDETGSCRPGQDHGHGPDHKKTVTAAPKTLPRPGCCIPG